ncbi:hypothetical protein Vafri_18768 [Volvox africanus]|uniref:Uncharacterized protein n=1 Tax=Volvox africanus TaxID=51714 RepID=A0A8J4BMN4_9CHLO|nr:hypothetical protein Vafri_18768 [Volvox africanus]
MSSAATITNTITKTLSKTNTNTAVTNIITITITNTNTINTTITINNTDNNAVTTNTTTSHYHNHHQQYHHHQQQQQLGMPPGGLVAFVVSEQHRGSVPLSLWPPLSNPILALQAGASKYRTTDQYCCTPRWLTSPLPVRSVWLHCNGVGPHPGASS